MEEDELKFEDGTIIKEGDFIIHPVGLRMLVTEVQNYGNGNEGASNLMTVYVSEHGLVNRGWDIFSLKKFLKLGGKIESNN